MAPDSRIALNSWRLSRSTLRCLALSGCGAQREGSGAACGALRRVEHSASKDQHGDAKRPPPVACQKCRRSRRKPCRAGRGNRRGGRENLLPAPCGGRACFDPLCCRWHKGAGRGTEPSMAAPAPGNPFVSAAAFARPVYRASCRAGCGAWRKRSRRRAGFAVSTASIFLSKAATIR